MIKRILGSPHGGILLFALLFLCVTTLTRVVLLVATAADVSWNSSLLAAFGWGFVYDLGGVAWAATPLILIVTFLPGRWGHSAWQRFVSHLIGYVIAYIVIFGAVAEWFFWEEFSARFNFIAVDYLAYTQEVIGNIRESYPMPLIFALVAVGAALAHLAMWKSGLPAQWFSRPASTFKKRAIAGAIWMVGAVAFGLLLDQSQLSSFRNNYNRELAKSGLWSLFAAFWDNELNYDQFYKTLPLDEAFALLRKELVQDGSVLLKPGEPDSIRWVSNQGPELHPNVIQITVESLSAKFLGHFNPQSKLTPNLDALAEKCLVFENFYATGTRTDRGMEALTLSLPPTPGRSIIKRPENEDLFTLGSLFRSRGYDTAFIYGGYGYFDNMNYYFGHNGYRIVDRNSVEKSDITFANAWGACDEDLFRWTIREADRSFAAGKPFHYFLMTTSNHRPFTYPDGKIDLPSKEAGRDGGVKYTDYAIAKLIEDASGRPWFKNTIFVIVADHCGSVAGKVEVPVENYHIPLLIYSPGGQIAPGKMTTLTSQIDYAPTLLGLLNWSYPSRFFGHDVRKIAPEDAHALLGNYQKLGHLENGVFDLLGPMKTETLSGFDYTTMTRSTTPPSIPTEPETVAYYQTASYMFRNKLYRALTPDELTQFTRAGSQPATSAGDTHDP